ncbi:uncharacterized protein [Montipora capricornis]|uniref:uncharacterized protein n=1 Tax=Montipora capricornis TaxID=246305 RepID=UPI0035F18475
MFCERKRSQPGDNEGMQDRTLNTQLKFTRDNTSKVKDSDGNGRSQWKKKRSWFTTKPLCFIQISESSLCQMPIADHLTESLRVSVSLLILFQPIFERNDSQVHDARTKTDLSRNAEHYFTHAKKTTKMSRESVTIKEAIKIKQEMVLKS